MPLSPVPNVADALAREIRRQAAEGHERLEMAGLLAISGRSRRQTERLFRDHHLTSPARFFRDCQTEIAERLLSEGHDVLSAALTSGFASPGRLHDAIVRRRGLTPGQLRRRGAGVRIAFGFFDTQIGVVLLAATERGLCSLRLCQFHGAEESLAEIQADFPRAELHERPEALQPYADQLVAFLDAQTPDFCPSMDVLLGTTFQREVWAELGRVRPGETVTYAALAARIGRPKAVRAVAGACASNQLAIAIPCHRAVRGDGSLAGYRWGIEWKRRLLELESQRAREDTPA
jgi:AraC family transcriptional regulator of adaptative response/methylated-DNA-[protein]-cysteine methyltransferase